MAVRVSIPVDKAIDVKLQLPASKSISNRALIIRALGNLNAEIVNLSEAQDTIRLLNILKGNTHFSDCGDGGTTSRFLLAYCCFKGLDVEISGSDQLNSRPVSELVNALNAIGAEITYKNHEGYLPVQTGKGILKGGALNIRGDISSQFLSALMMIGPLLPGGLKLNIDGEVLSRSYIDMTASVMRHYGAEVMLFESEIRIAETGYINNDLCVEPDWSAASYWYEACALRKDSRVELTGFSEETLQGDSVIYKMMNHLGVQTKFTDDSVVITNPNNGCEDYFLDDFTTSPDLGPAIAAACGGLNITADLTGLKNFRIKESDRAASLQRGLYDLSVKTDFCGGSKFKVYSGGGAKKTGRILKCYNDHRMAMAFSMMALIVGEILLDNIDCVKKSYPGFREDLVKAGFSIEDI